MGTIASRNPTPPAVPDAYAAQLQAQSLWDLVQGECLAGVREVVRVESGGQAGLLFFDKGRIVHAETARAIGEPAALEILAWQSGSFDPCDARWPRLVSITGSAEGLLSKVQKGRRDSSASNLVAFPGPDMATDELPPITDPASWLYVDDNDGESDVTKPGTAKADEVGFPVVARVAADGTILEALDSELADAVAYVGRLSGLIGELLGLDGFRALECASKDERVVIYADETGGLVGGRMSIGADVGPLRNRLGL